MLPCLHSSNSYPARKFHRNQTWRSCDPVRSELIRIIPEKSVSGSRISMAPKTHFLAAVWHGGPVLISIDEVAILWALSVVGWETAFLQVNHLVM